MKTIRFLIIPTQVGPGRDKLAQSIQSLLLAAAVVMGAGQAFGQVERICDA